MDGMKKKKLPVIDRSKLRRQLLFYFYGSMALFVLSLLPFASAGRLEDSPLYQAVQKEDLPAFLHALDSFESLSEPEKIKWAEERDNNGENIFHLLAGVKKRRQTFALEMIKLFIFLQADQVFLDALNQDGLRPEDVARREG